MHFFQALVSLPLIAGAVASPLNTRATLENCNDEGVQAINNALAQAAKMAHAGANLIQSESDYSYSLFQSFFKTNNAQSRNRVAGVLEKIATEATNGNQGVVSYYCTPEGINCVDNHSFTMTAYGETDGTYGRIRTCPAYFTKFAAWSNSCSVLDQATSSLHEMAHTKGIFGPETYGYEEVHGLSSSSALENAESYAFFSKCKFLHYFHKDSELLTLFLSGFPQLRYHQLSSLLCEKKVCQERLLSGLSGRQVCSRGCI
jgi:deuterolysin